MSKIAVDRLGGVEETLLLPLWARALETRKAHGLICDPKSLEVFESLDYDFRRLGRGWAFRMGCCLRGLQFDHWAREYLREHPHGVVVEVGAGLNTRFERVDNGLVRWFDLDLPAAMAVRRQFFGETDRRAFLAGSVLDPGWTGGVAAAACGPVLLVCEGVLPYFTRDQVRGLFAMLRGAFPAGTLVAFDSASPWLSANQARGVLRHVGASFQWATDDVREVEGWGDDYLVVQSRDMNTIARKRLTVRQMLPLLAGKVFQVFRPGTASGYRLHLVRLGDPAVG